MNAPEPSRAMLLMRLRRRDLIARHQQLTRSRSRADYRRMTSEQITAAILALEERRG